MARKKPQRQQPRPLDDAVLFRAAVADATTANREERSLELVLATESPVDVWDISRGEVLKETMRMDGVSIPDNGQIPLVDSHSRHTVQDVLGSIRELRTEGGRLLGRAFFADNELARQTFANYADGHLTDFSVGARIVELKYDDDDRRVVARSELIEGSAVVKGADPNAKALPDSFRAYADPEAMKDESMTSQLKNKLIARGLPEDADDKALWEFLDAQLDRQADESAESHAEFLRGIRDELKRMKSPESPDIDDIKRQLKEDADAELTRQADIRSLCKRHNASPEDEEKWIREKTSVADVSRKLLDDIASGGVPIGQGSDVGFGLSDREKFYDAALAAVTRRAVIGAELSPHTMIQNSQRRNDWDALERSQNLKAEFEKPPVGANEFAHTGLMDLARMFCDRAGIRTKGVPNVQIAREAMKMREFVQRASDGPAFTTTGTFTNLMLDASNKTLLAAYDEAAVTYTTWVRQAPSTPDFKQLNRIRFGELPDPEVVPESHPYPDKAPSDQREFYRVEKYGEIFSISLEAVVNDDLNAISRAPAMLGNAMRRKINKEVYQLLADNPTLNADSIALFHATSHNANLDTVALSATAINTGYTVMMTQTGIQSGTVLNIMPRYLIGGAALSDTILQIIGSQADPSNAAASTEDASRPNFNSGTINLYGPNGSRPLTPVVDGQIDSLDSATAWYLAASPSQVDTFEITFLQGEETPVIDTEEGFTTDTVKSKVRQSWAVAAIDFRGLYQGNT